MTLQKQLAQSMVAKDSPAEEHSTSQVPGCEVIEFDELSGQQKWLDSVFVQDFTDSVLATTPVPLDCGSASED
jgi:hypothetical protein